MSRSAIRRKQRLKQGFPQPVKKTAHETGKPVRKPLPLYGFSGEERPGISAASGAQEKKNKQDKEGKDTGPRAVRRTNLFKNGGGGWRFHQREKYTLNNAQRHIQPGTSLQTDLSGFLNRYVIFAQV
jgi:hypothetical protein